MKLLFLAFLATTLTGLGFCPGHADARRFGGGGAVRGYGAGGFSGGSFRAGGGWATGPRGGGAVVGPRGGAAVKGPGGYGAARGAGGGAAVKGPGGTYVHGGGSYNGNINLNRNVTVNQGWGAWGYRPGALAAGAAAGVAAGAAVASLPPSYQTVVISGQTYYVANGAYYQQCYQGAEVGYCAVARPY